MPWHNVVPFGKSCLICVVTSEFLRPLRIVLVVMGGFSRRIRDARRYVQSRGVLHLKNMNVYS